LPETEIYTSSPFREIFKQLQSRNSLQPDAGFKVLTAVAIKSTIYWDITPCSPLKVNRRFGESFRPHLQVRRTNQARNQCESKWRWRRCVPPKCRWTFNGQHDVISQKIVLFILDGIRFAVGN
jgi:hypothetical protein